MAPQNIKFCACFRKLCDLIANISGMQQDIGSSIANYDHPAHAHLTW